MCTSNDESFTRRVDSLVKLDSCLVFERASREDILSHPEWKKQKQKELVRTNGQLKTSESIAAPFHPLDTTAILVLLYNYCSVVYKKAWLDILWPTCKHPTNSLQINTSYQYRYEVHLFLA